MCKYLSGMDSVDRGGALCLRARAWAAPGDRLCLAGCAGGAVVGSVFTLFAECVQNGAAPPALLGLALKTIFCMDGELAKRRLSGPEDTTWDRGLFFSTVGTGVRASSPLRA